MGLELQVPEELLLEIVQHLPKGALQHVSLAHRTLWRISRPFLFADFVFHPYGIRYMPTDRSRVRWPEADDPVCLYDEAQEREVERLEFWSSPEIAPLVRSCSIIPLSSREWAERKAVDAPTALLNIFFERLPHFAGIHHFHAYIVHFTETGLENLCGLPGLTHLQIILCRIPEPLDCASLQLPRVTSFGIRHVLRPPTFCQWVGLLRPTHLVEMHLGFGPHLLMKIPNRIPSFPHVRKLTLYAVPTGETMGPNRGPRVLPILPKFPGVTNFVMEGRWGRWDDQFELGAHDLLPMLREYDGPAEMLRIFLNRATLARLTLNTNTFYWQSRITDVLQGTLPSNNVFSLTATSSPLDVTAFHSLFNIFPYLTALNITISYGYWDKPNLPGTSLNFIENLPSIQYFPPLLEFLSIRWKHFKLDVSNAEDDDASNSADRLRHFVGLRGLVSSSLALTSVWIEGPAFLYRWRRLSDGTVDEQTVRNSN
ncbi:hypothetical protein B0H14DRAFT_2729023 [Mycena olivaceomarginata]|nr:hypothetical protein B0H14DRAFT_2729023 [Mycena olivaceomarginata]